MRTSDFDYPLPADLIAQTSAEPRDSARLLVVHRGTGELEHRIFRDIGDYLGPNDVLVRNDTRVVPARLRGHKAGTGGKVEALLLRPHGGSSPVGRGLVPRRSPGGPQGPALQDQATVWEALVKPAGRLRSGSVIEFGTLSAEVVGVMAEGTRLLRFPDGASPERMGETPLPPYIREKVQDPERYQTVYAREPGSAAAPTAGLHFTPSLLEDLQAKGTEVVSLTLHIGLDTFRPVRHEDPREHGIHQEFYHLDPEAAGRLTEAAQEGKRLVCVGTTSVRALEDAARRSFQPYAGLTGLYILPGFEFRAAGAVITNFHLPRTTLLMLVSAFAGRELILRAYEEAVRLRYRFYSFGDALLIL